MEIRFTKHFVKSYDKSPTKVRKAFDVRLWLLNQDKFHPLLNNHALTGKCKNYRSINITGDWRAIFREYKEGEIVYFEVLGTHSELYK